MAKKDTGRKKAPAAEKQAPEAEKKPPGRGDAVRAAAAQAIEATAGQAGFTRERAQQLADELVHAAGRFRETLEELRPVAADEVGALRERLEALEARVEQLEAARAAPPADHADRAPAGRRDLSAGIAWPGGAFLITGVANSFGTRLAHLLVADAGVERVVGVDTRPARPRVRGPRA